MAKLTTTTIQGAYASTSELNANFVLIEAAMEKALFLDGTTPNTMSADIDLDGHDLLNVGQITYDPHNATSAELLDIADAVNTGAAKVQGFQMYDTTLDQPVWAVGAADGDIWVDGVGATVHTPV